MKRYIKILCLELILLFTTVICSVAQENKPDSTDSVCRPTFGETSSVSSIEAEGLIDEYVDNVGNTLSGKILGLYVAQSSGEPGKAQPSYSIRGCRSFNVNNPLIFVDGFESPISDINPSEIESISVLKDAAALNIFGVKGADGVIWVTTKRGTSGPAKVNVNLNVGMQQPVILPQFAGSYDYASLYNEALSNDKGTWTQFYSTETLAKYQNGNDGSEYYDLLYPNVKWYDQVLKAFAPAINSDVSFSGGSRRMTYFVDLGYQDVDGLYSGTDSKRKVNSNINYQKFNYRTSVKSIISNVFDISAIVGGSISDRYTPVYSTESMWENMMSYPANAYPVLTPSGYGGTALYPDNPKATVLETGFRHYHYRNVQATVTLGENLDFILKNLRLTETVSIYNNQSQTYTKSKNYLRYSPIISDGVLSYVTYGSQDTDFTIAQTGTSYNSYLNRLNAEVALSWSNSYGCNGFAAEIKYHDDKETNAGTLPPIYTRNISGMMSYNYSKRYYFELMGSYSGMSVYNPLHDMGFFPSVSAAWIASNEAFLQDRKNVNYLKLRGSLGLVGMDDISTAKNYYMYQQYYRSDNSSSKFGWEGTSSLSTLYEYYIANPDASWEKSLKADVGVDAVLFANRLSFSGDVFFENRYDILTTPNILSYTGILSDANFNDGKVLNRGFEFSAGWQDRIGVFGYSFGCNFTFARNKIVYMDEAATLYDYQRYTGNRIGTYKCLVADGLFQSWDEINSSSTPEYTYAVVQPGDIKYVDQNKDGYIDDNDRVYASNYYPNAPEIYYGINAGIEFKGFDLKATGYGVANYTVNVRNILNSAYENGTGNLSLTALKNRWAYYPDHGIDTRAAATYPRLSTGSNFNNWRNSTFWLRDGSFFRISDVTLGYTISTKLQKRLHVGACRIFVSGTNLAVFDHLDVGDPEDPTGYPIERTYLLGVNLKF